jgi:tetratricopeptide (TPR) repeat protein
MQYQKSIECYHKALAINPLFENSWFVMACAAMKIEEWDIAVRALNRVTSLDSEVLQYFSNYERMVKLGIIWHLYSSNKKRSGKHGVPLGRH